MTVEPRDKNAANTPFWRRLKIVGVGVVAFLLCAWLAMVFATALLKHQTATLDFLSGIESIKHWFIVARIAFYASVLALWPWILRHFKPTLSNDNVRLSRQMMLRFFIVYELLFGINIIQWILH